MKLNKLIIASLAALVSFSAANAAVTITFNAGFVGGLSSNLANTAGVVSNGLKYGIIVSTDASAILTEYDLVPFTLGSSVALTSNTASTGDRLILANDLTSDSSQGGVFVEGDGTTPGGNGGVAGISFAFGDGVAAGQAFTLVWIDETTNRAGALTHAQFIIPPDGATVSQDQVFVGVDPVRPATNITFVPEPSAALLGLLGIFGLVRRRR
jgi:hypothetical protein